MSDSDISVTNYRIWKQNPVTIKLFKFLKELRIDLEMQMLDGAVIMHHDSEKFLSKLLGMREGLDLILQMEFEDINNGVVE